MAHKVGHDYGIKPFTMVVSDFGFIDFFSKADWLGLMYLFGESGKEMVPVEIGFFFRNREPAAAFMELLMSWSKDSQEGQDVLDIDFIEKKNGKYVIAITPNIDSLSSRLVPDYLRDKVTQLTVTPFHFKELDISENFKLLKENYINGTEIPVGYFIGSPDLTSKAPRKGEGFFIKKNINFYNENDEGVQIVDKYKRMSEKKFQKTHDKPTAEEKAENTAAANARRLTEIQLYYPITYNKITKQHWLNEIYNQLNKKYPEDLIIQAICNLVLLERLNKEGKLTKDFIDNGLANNILNYLCTNHESFRSYYPNDDFFTKYKIESQINRDRKEFSNFLSK